MASSAHAQSEQAWAGKDHQRPKAEVTSKVDQAAEDAQEILHSTNFFCTVG